MDKHTLVHPLLVGSTAIASATFAGLTAFEWAAWTAAALNVCLIVNWFWRKLGKPFYQRLKKVPEAREFMATTKKGDL
jgi:hypothetical protein